MIVRLLRRIKEKTMSESKKPMYKVETKRDADMVKSFVLFTYRQRHPKVTRNFLLIGMLSLALTIGIRIHWFGILLMVQGIFCILMAFFRHLIPVSTIKRNDPDYIEGNILTYEFRDHKIEAFRNGELFLSVVPYSKVTNLYYDEKYFYIGANEEDFMMLPKKDFVTGDPETFTEFIEKKAKISAVYSPATYAEQRRKHKAESEERIKKQEEARLAEMAQMEESKALMKEALAERRRRVKEKRARELSEAAANKLPDEAPSESEHE